MRCAITINLRFTYLLYLTSIFRAYNRFTWDVDPCTHLAVTYCIEVVPTGRQDGRAVAVTTYRRVNGR